MVDPHPNLGLLECLQTVEPLELGLGQHGVETLSRNVAHP